MSAVHLQDGCLQMMIYNKTPMKILWVAVTAIALASTNGAAADDLLARLSSPQPPVRLAAMQELEQLPADAKHALVPVWLKEAQSSDPAMQRQAATGLALLGPEAPDATPWMTEALKGTDNAMRASALTYFSNAGPKTAQTVLPQILQALKDPLPDVRGRAADAVGVMGAAAPEAGPVLLDLVMNDSDAGVQSHAINALQFMGPAGHNPLLDQLAQKLKDPNKEVQVQAARALWRIGLGAQQTAPELVATLQDQDLAVKRYAAFALAAMHAAPKEALPILIHALASKTLSGMAGMALYQVGEPAVKPLIQALSAESLAERKGAILALERLGSEARPAIPALTRALHDQNPSVQQLAAKALKTIQ
jgi:HEAT repeat protein